MRVQLCLLRSVDAPSEEAPVLVSVRLRLLDKGQRVVRRTVLVRLAAASVPHADGVGVGAVAVHADAVGVVSCIACRKAMAMVPR